MCDWVLLNPWHTVKVKGGLTGQQEGLHWSHYADFRQRFRSFQGCSATLPLHPSQKQDSFAGTFTTFIYQSVQGQNTFKTLTLLFWWLANTAALSAAGRLCNGWNSKQHALSMKKKRATEKLNCPLTSGNCPNLHQPMHPVAITTKPRTETSNTLLTACSPDCRQRCRYHILHASCCCYQGLALPVCTHLSFWYLGTTIYSLAVGKQVSSC